jgi:hypothetical protein
VQASQNGEKIPIFTPMRREKDACRGKTLFYLHLLLNIHYNILPNVYTLM